MLGQAIAAIPDFAPTETVEVALCGHMYRVTGSPTIAADNFFAVQVFRAETAGRRSCWSFLSHTKHFKLRNAVRAKALANTDDEDHATRCITTGQHRNDGRGMCIDCDYAMGAA